MASVKDIRGRISSVKNIRKITRAMEMVAAARLRRAEQRIEHLRPYAEAIRRMTQRASEAAENIPSLPILQERENIQTVGLLLVTGDRGLAGPFNSQIIRAGNRRAAELRSEGKTVLWYASGRRGESSLKFRGLEAGGTWTGFTDRPAYSDAREFTGSTTRFLGDYTGMAARTNGFVGVMPFTAPVSSAGKSQVFVADVREKHAKKPRAAKNKKKKKRKRKRG